jgi:acetyl/propionyl-CoA carboxylase alpha subunit
MIRAIDDYQLTGIETTLPFGKFVMQHEAFITANFDTKFIEKYFSPDLLEKASIGVSQAAIFASGQLFYQSENKQNHVKNADEQSNWFLKRKGN